MRGRAATRPGTRCAIAAFCGGAGLAAAEPSAAPAATLAPGMGAPPDGLFCFVVIAAEFGDVPRVVNILNHQDSDAGFVGCDSFRIYSNVTRLNGISGHRRCNYCVEKAVTGSMDVPLGEPAGCAWKPTALNTPIFQQVWKHAVATAPWRQHAWTVKTEVDVVFAASRLRDYLMNRPPIAETDAKRLIGQAAFGYNWHGSLHGPVEALTSHAVAALAAQPTVCDRVAQNNPRKGEDWWLDLCMLAIGVRGVAQDLQLLDDGSNVKFDGPRGPQFSACDQDFAAYHPRKKIADWNLCYDELARCKRNTSGCNGRHPISTEKFEVQCDPRHQRDGQPAQSNGRNARRARLET